MNGLLKIMATMMLLMVVAVSCNKPEASDDGGNENVNEFNDHTFVDLGLPSGTLWATCNVGADAAEGFGDFFAWGETEPKELYDWKSYKYGVFFYERYELNKYCTDSVYGQNGLVDHLTLLEPNDDAARVCWGEDWRMPTIKEWEELFLNTTNTWVVQNGVNGWLLAASNGNSIFLPAAGYWWEGVYNANLGLYWSSSINKEYPYRAWSFHFNSDSSHLCGSSDRNRGQTVRAVRLGK